MKRYQQKASLFVFYIKNKKKQKNVYHKQS